MGISTWNLIVESATVSYVTWGEAHAVGCFHDFGSVSSVTWGEASHLGIKIILLLAVILGLIYVSRLKGARNLALRRIFALLFAIGAAVAILYPPLISKVARFLGVGRGTDLLLYALVVVVLATWLVQWRYNIAVQARLTELTRSLALANPQKPSEEQ